jgi:hypothetical protein
MLFRASIKAYVGVQDLIKAAYNMLGESRSYRKKEKSRTQQQQSNQFGQPSKTLFPLLYVLFLSQQPKQYFCPNSELHSRILFYFVRKSMCWEDNIPFLIVFYFQHDDITFSIF